MKIIHGENIVQSRRHLNQLTDPFKGEIIRLDANQMEMSGFKQALESSSIFGLEKMVVVENLFTGRKKKIKDEAIDYLRKEKPKNLIVWEPKQVDGRKLISFKNAQINKYELTKYLFKFLESLKPGNQKESLRLLDLVLENDPPEIVFYMLIRQSRLLLIAKDLGAGGLSKMAPWQKNRLTAQAKLFTIERLLTLHRQLLKIDYEQKTGQAIFPLKQTLELLIADL